MRIGGRDMVKIEIDDAVRSYALVYSQQVMVICNGVEEKLAALGTFVADNNDWNALLSG